MCLLCSSDITGNILLITLIVLVGSGSSVKIDIFLQLYPSVLQYALRLIDLFHNIVVAALFWKSLGLQEVQPVLSDTITH